MKTIPNDPFFFSVIFCNQESARAGTLRFWKYHKISNQRNE